MSGPELPELLADPALHRALRDFVIRRLPPADTEDVVQTVLCEALSAKDRPTDPAALKKYLLGMARHKVADVHRQGAREEVRELPDLSTTSPPLEEASMLRWAERQAPATEDAKKTLAWMAREVEGERFESIAAEENVPAERVRQRVRRMRRWMKERWMLELAAVAALAVAALVLWRLLRERQAPEVIAPDVSTKLPQAPTPLDRARALRAEAQRRCDEGAFRACLDGLDEAARLDPAGDGAPEVQEARARARRALELDGKRLPPEDTKSPAPLPTTQQPSPAPIQRVTPKDVESVPRKPSSKSVPKGIELEDAPPAKSSPPEAPGNTRKGETFLKK